MEYIINVDRKGRIVVPIEIRRKLGIKRAVKLIVEEERIIIEPIRDPIKRLRSMVELKIIASQTPEKISRIAEEELKNI